MKLSYFPARGVVEKIRYMLAIGEVVYEDYRYPLSFGTPGDFSTVIRPEFDADKASGKLDVSMGKVPVLEVDGIEIGQSKAIERYVARKYGMMGSTDEEAAKIDCVAEHERDIKDMYMKAKAAEKKDEFFEKTLPEMLAKVEASLPQGPGPFLFGEKVSYADVVFFVFLTEFFDDKDKAAAATPSKIKAAIDAVAAIPQVQKWKAERPDTPF
ncbi:hypothetical protein CTAYLR_007987 [Chrysophaeum taylorii]|uniref:Glutathione S-transferase n=1 Tax=Chrysophaeum taylorii TaxID=2483200 RepID=A0AAD7U729_9STRA|nr:hypothetical protein CTAYLR_007987 [Chrysophaeum taylorii]